MTTDNVQYFDGHVINFIPKYNNTGLLSARHCIRETFMEGPVPGCLDGHWFKIWAFHYSDGTLEQLKRIIKK